MAAGADHRSTARLALALLLSTLCTACGTPDADVLVTIEDGVFGQLSSSSDVFPPPPRRYYEDRAVGLANADGQWRNTLTDVNGFYEISAPPDTYILCYASSSGTLRQLDRNVTWPTDAPADDAPLTEESFEQSGDDVEVEGCYRNFIRLGGLRRCDHAGAPPMWRCGN